MGSQSKYDWTDEKLISMAESGLTSLKQIATEWGSTYTALTSHLHNHPELNEKLKKIVKDNRQQSRTPTDKLPDEIHNTLRRTSRANRLTVESLSDKFDVSPKRIRGCLDILRSRGIRVPDELDSPDGSISLEKVVPVKHNIHTSLLSGDKIRIGVVSDTHLNSNEEAVQELHAAYDLFVEEEISEVLHAGDLVAGRGIYRTQDAEIKNHTFETQVGYAVANYPEREGIKTRMISGNHDIEGDFGRIGADPVMATALRRQDIEYLGPFSAWVELPNGGNIHLLHGKGGASYAFSYKAQKLAEGYPQGRKPSILIPGHYHRAGSLDVRGIQVLFPGCFEWKTHLLERLGLTPAVGFWILTLTLGEDGSLVRFNPEWFRFFEGRVVR